MPFLRCGLRSLLSTAVAAAVCVPLLAAPPAGASPETGQAPADDVVTAPSTAEADDTAVSDRIIVKFEEDAAATPRGRGHAYGKVAKELGVAVEELRETSAGAVVVEVTEEPTAQGIEEVAAALNAHPDVAYAEVDLLLHPLAVPNDQFYSYQWNLQDEAAGESAGLRLPRAWDRASGAGQTIAILDTGITEHSDLAPNVLPGYDFIVDPAASVDGNGRDSDPRDPGDACDGVADGAEPTLSSWHGTHVAGIAGADNDGRGVVGVAYDAKILPLRVIGACHGYLSDTVDALRWAAGGDVEGVPANPTPARVINMSLGAEESCAASLQEAIDFAVGQGAVVVAAAGNEAQPAANVTPANCGQVITVGATSRAGDSAVYSNFGPELDVSTPGGDGMAASGNILSTWNTGDIDPGAPAHGYMQGTSMAAPHVAGVAALMLSVNPELDAVQIERLLRQTARPLPGVCFETCGAGLVDADAAVAAAAGVAVTPFKDIGDSLFREDIEWMYENDLTTGYPDGTFRPHLTMSREAMAAFLYRLAGRPTFPQPTAPPFTDVPVHHQFAKEIAWMKATGISKGYDDKSFRPGAGIKRDAMAAFLHRFSASYCDVSAAKYYNPSNAGSFADVTAKTMFYREISWMYHAGISTGWVVDGTRTYRPLGGVTRDAMAAFVHRLDTYQDVNGGCRN